MSAVVVYESLWGNTAAIAKAIAEGLGEGARALSTSQADAAALAGVDLIVAGAPLLGFSLPTEDMRKNIASNPTGRKADVSAPSMRAWLASLPVSERGVAGFETRIWWSPGSAAKTIVQLASEKGCHQVAPPEKFLVTGRYGPLKDGEIERARAWGASLASLMVPVE